MPYGTRCNGRKDFGDSMPGSLNYSPSESKGGCLRIGQADLDKWTGGDRLRGYSRGETYEAHTCEILVNVSQVQLSYSTN